jgi:trigger factor
MKILSNVLFAICSNIRTLAAIMSHDHHHHAVDFKTAFTVEKLPGSEVKISGELPYVELDSERTPAIVALGKNVEIDGFRKGHVPQNILVKHLGEMTILAEMAERAIAHAYPHILEDHKIEAIGHPKIELTKIAPNNPLGFTVTVAVIPEITLADYKEIAKKVNAEKPSAEVTDEDVNDQISDILRQKAAYERLQKKASNTSNEGDALPSVDEEATDIEKPNLEIPELTDEVAMSLGQAGQFTGVDDLKAKLKEHLSIEKKNESTAKHRAALTDAITEETKLDLPRILIESELNQMLAQMQEDLDRADLKMDDYLSHIKKTKEELLKEWEPAAETRAKLQLILNEIAKVEELVPNKDKVEEQTKVLMERFKDADEMRVRLYVASVLLNEDVMQKLESF